MNQLPIDGSGGALLPFEQGVFALPTSPQRPTFQEELAALVVLLHRLTAAAMVTFDVRPPSASSLVHVTLDVTAEMNVAELAAALPAIVAAAPPRASEKRSNVAVAWDGPAPDGCDLFLRLGSEARCEYHAGLFLPGTIERLTANLGSILGRRPEWPTATIGDLDFLTGTEQAIVTADGPIDAAHELVPFHESFEAWARKTPDATAATTDHAHLTYGELSRRSNQLANYLASQGLGAGDAIGVCLGPRVDVLVAILAIFKLGCIYVPLDPTHPMALTRHILSEALPKLVLVEGPALREAIGEACVVQDIDEACMRAAACEVAAPIARVALDARSYTLFTSGTTGKPKGVLATHLNLAHYLRSACNAYGFAPSDKFCSIARYTFSISMFELLAPLCAGASVRLLRRDDVLQPEVFSRILEEVSVVHAGPSLLSSLFRYVHEASERTFPNIRHASSGGDLVGADVMEGMKRTFPNAELFVIYGCTEISCMGCTYPIRRDLETTRSFVGRPFPNMKVRVLDAMAQQVPIGVVGEIWFAGLGVVPGYLNREELNQVKFASWHDDRYYRTGDLGRFHADGTVEILGRSDFQVQVRGMRVELAGLEATTRRLGLATQCAAALKRLDAEDARLVLFVVSDKANAEGMRKRLAEELPDYMVPQHIVPVASLPLTANGKLDRRALDDLPWRPTASQDAGVAPRSKMERQTAQAFALALDVAAVGIDDDFFELGGHSLSAVKVADQLQNLLGMTVSPGALFEAPTVRRLVQHLSESQTSAHRPILLTRDGTKPKLFLIAGVHIYRDLARELEHNYSVYGVYAGAELALFDQKAKAAPVPDLARRYVEVIRREQPHGPYRIAGLSFGGIVVYEAAQQLLASGEPVAFVGLLDAMLPERGLTGVLHKLTRFARLPFGRELDLIRGTASKHLWPQGPRARRAEFAAHDDATFAQMELLREDSYRGSARDYAANVRDFPGPVTLIVAGRRLERAPMSDRNCGWKGLVSRLDAHVVDAEHLGLMQAPSVTEVAALLDAACQRSEP